MIRNEIEKKLNIHKTNNLIRTVHSIKKYENNIIEFNDQKFLNFTSNDYLYLSYHPKIKSTFKKGIELFGIGSNASALISGKFDIHNKLEKHFAQFIGCDDAILFNSGYQANYGLITAFGELDNTVFIIDKNSHASIYDGLRASKTKFFRYKTNDFLTLEKLLKSIPQNKIVISESIYSMEGNIANIKSISHLCKQNNTSLIVDDAHGIGILGKTGRGIVEHYNLSNNDISLIIMPLGKAFASMGCIVAGNKIFIEYLRQFARSYIYTTNISPAIAYANLATLKIIQTESWRRNKLNDNILYFNSIAKQYQIPLLSSDLTPIKSIILSNSTKTLSIHKNLLDNGYFTSCIRPPTVSPSTSRIRVSLNTQHTKPQILSLLQNLSQSLKQY